MAIFALGAFVGVTTNVVMSVTGAVLGWTFNQDGCKFYKNKNFAKAYDCFRKAVELEPTIGRCHRNLALVYETMPASQSPDRAGKDLFQAAKHYLLANANGFAQGQIDYERLLTIHEISGIALNNLGNLFINGYGDKHAGNGIQPNLDEAMRLYALGIAKGCTVSYWNMGLCYERKGQYLEAARYYQQAITRGYDWAQQRLNDLLYKAKIEGSICAQIGVMFANGVEVEQNEAEAVKWFRKGMDQGDATSFYYIGTFYEGGLGGLPRDHLQAAMHYQEAHAKQYALAQQALTQLQNRTDPGTRAYILSPDDLYILRRSPHLSKKNFKAIFSKIIYRRFKSNPADFLDARDEYNMTLMDHAAAINRHGPLYKVCARLLVLNANPAILTNLWSVPSNVQDLRKVRHLQVQINSLIGRIHSRMTPPQVLSHQFTAQNGIVNHLGVGCALFSLYQIQGIRPLMDLAKLASFSLHDIAARQRRRFSEDGYDSDHDDTEGGENWEECRFQIVVDANPDTGSLRHICQDNNADGKYWNNTSTIYFCQRQDKRAAHGTLCHEMCHFIAYEVFKNLCKPYAQGDLRNKNLFTCISEDLEGRKERLHVILKGAFDYPAANYHAELIARVAQILALEDEGEKILHEQAPDLLAYYETVFLNTVKQHIEKIKARAFGGWSQELLESRLTHEFVLHEERRECLDFL